MLAPDIQLPDLSEPHAHLLSAALASGGEGADLTAAFDTAPELRAAVLRAADTVAGGSRPAASAASAVDVLGLAEARRITICAVLLSAFAEWPVARVDVNELWRHALACALLTEAQQSDGTAAAFAAGLLHDVGRLVLAADLERYPRVVDRIRGGIDSLEAESRAYGIEHATLGAQVCERWGVPAEIRHAVACHHSGAGGGLALAVMSARHLSWGLGISDGVLPPPRPAHAQAVSRDAVSQLGGRDALRSRIDLYLKALAVMATGAQNSPRTSGLERTWYPR